MVRFPSIFQLFLRLLRSAILCAFAANVHPRQFWDISRDTLAIVQRISLLGALRRL